MIPKIFDFINVISADGEELVMVDSHVMGFAHVKSIAGSERIGASNAVGCRLFLDDRQQGLRPYVGDNGGANLPAPLKQAEYGHFPECSSTSLSFASASEVTFICFDLPTQLATRKLVCNETTKVHEKTSCGVAMDANYFGCRLVSCSNYDHPIPTP